MPLKRAFGEVLFSVRLQHGLTLHQLAVLLAISDQRVREMETGKTAPTPTEMAAIEAQFKAARDAADPNTCPYLQTVQAMKDQLTAETAPNPEDVPPDA